MDKQLWQKYLDGQCSPEEQDLVNSYLAEEHSDTSLLKELLQSSWAASSEEPIGKAATFRMLSRLRASLYPQRDTASIHNSRRIIWLSAAACIAVLVITATVLLVKSRTSAAQRETLAAVVQWKTIRNIGAVIKSAWLPDSTRIWLMPNTTLSYAANFKDRRSVKLEGEAYFDVARDPLHAFIVTSGAISTQVLGTAFNIESYPNEQRIRVSLVQGSVAIRDTARAAAAQPPAYLQAGQLLTYDRTTHASSQGVLSTADLTAWTRGYTVLNDVLVTDAIARIAGRSNMTVVYAEGIHLEHKRVTTVFTTKTPEEMLNLLLFVYKYSYRRTGNILEIINTH